MTEPPAPLSATTRASTEGGLTATARKPLAWQEPDFYDRQAVDAELERVFDICHGCRRCVSLCQSFPVLFDLVDESETMEVDGVASDDYGKVVAHCYLCDLCFQVKCPYVPPHEFDVDFPHLMLRAKAAQYREQGVRWRDALLTKTDMLADIATIPLVDKTYRAAVDTGWVRTFAAKTVGIAADAPAPRYQAKTARRRLKGHASAVTAQVATQGTNGRVAIYTTCYCNGAAPEIIEDMVATFEHNQIATQLLAQEKCCGMPRLELGDIAAADKARQQNIPIMLAALDDGYDLVAAVPSCVLMFRRELPLLFPDDADVARVAARFFDPMEYLWRRHKGNALRPFPEPPKTTDAHPEVLSYQVACHQRVQNLGNLTRNVLQLIPGLEVKTIERCSGHDGTYAVKVETRAASLKIAAPVRKHYERSGASTHTSDCPLAMRQITPEGGAHPMSLVRRAYGL